MIDLPSLEETEALKRIYQRRKEDPNTTDDDRDFCIVCIGILDDTIKKIKQQQITQKET